ncbi:MAG: hypothetical protein RRZ92_00770 [Bacilli bacterium]
MNINRAQLRDNKCIEFKETVHLNPDFYKDSTLIADINALEVVAKCKETDDILIMQLNVKGLVSLISCYTLKPFDYDLSCSEEVYITDDKDKENDVIFYSNKSVINIDEIIYSLVYCSLPVAPVKKGEKLPKNGKDYTIRKEE